MLILLSPLTKVSVLISWACQHHKRNKKQFYKNQNRSTGVCSVNLFSGVVSSTSPSMSSDTDLEALIFIKSTSVNSSDVVSYSFWNFPWSIPSNASDSCIIVALSTISFMFSLIGSVINPVNAPITSEQFSPTGIRFRLDAFYGSLYNNDAIFNNPSRHSWCFLYWGSFK